MNKDVKDEDGDQAIRFALYARALVVHPCRLLLAAVLSLLESKLHCRNGKNIFYFIYLIRAASLRETKCYGKREILTVNAVGIGNKVYSLP